METIALPEPHCAFDPEFATIWNSAQDVETALWKLQQKYPKASPSAIRRYVRQLTAAGICRELPVVHQGQILSQATVFEFCMAWTRHAQLADVAKSLQMNSHTVLSRWRLLRLLGLRLDTKPDMQQYAKGKGIRPKDWNGSLEELNRLLDGELLIRRALARQKPIKEKLVAAFALLSTTSSFVDETNNTVDNNLRAVVSLLHDVYRDLEVL